MGLDVSHDCWSGAYSAFMRWRAKLAEVAGMPPLDMMEGFYDENATYCLAGVPDRFRQGLPIRWDCLKPKPIHILLRHSDCEGYIDVKDCFKIAEALRSLMPLLPDGEERGHIGNWRMKTQKFIDGLLVAIAANERVRFA